MEQQYFGDGEHNQGDADAHDHGYESDYDDDQNDLIEHYGDSY